MSDAAGNRREACERLGREIREHVEAADLEGAGRLAAERHRVLREVLDDPQRQLADESLARWLRDMLRGDQALLALLGELRGRLEDEFGSARRSLHRVRAYASVAESAGGP